MTSARRAAVLGSPIRHSLSPVLHGAAYAALGLDGWSYDAHECDEAGLPGFVDALGPEWAGLSLTMPLKRVALQVADRVCPLAEATGAANTLVLGPGGRLAENTDVIGIVAALREAGAGRAGRAVVLGAGGTAQAALAALRELGTDDPLVLVRDTARAGELQAAADRLGVSPTVRAALTDPARAAAELADADVVISTLPAGAADALAAASWSPSTTVVDVIYAPWPTAFAAGAAAAGCTVVSGLAMLLHQAVAQVELMTGRPGPVEAMRAALDAAVLARSS
ncbi:shikimate dehydrogenase [Pseudonocardia acidicola]|uniref:Shikimate dehydrogenase n=1 Tax=Pseudonocardia acidicola TaxID=2724939 RepID=A0ABX1SHG7_9PSEU|nr:shikimate dehydrogenase [Pseudonocardia acidicola]NMI01020.1 shikimate dehydrogenase [Pseudonocardia acidicola]